MAGLFAQGILWEQMHMIVRSYAKQMSSVRHLIWDLTLPLVSVFTGKGFDRVIRESFSHGPRDIEDLWQRDRQWVLSKWHWWGLFQTRWWSWRKVGIHRNPAQHLIQCHLINFNSTCMQYYGGIELSLLNLTKTFSKMHICPHTKQVRWFF